MIRYCVACGLLSVLFSSTVALAAGPGAERSETDRAIFFEILVDGTPAEIFQAWVREDRIDKFFGSGARRLEPREGGLYEIEFGVRPDGEIGGPRGNRILKYEPPSALDFEWGMPFFAEHLNARPLPTWVELRFEPFGDDGRRTRLRLVHHGFGDGEDWDRCFAFFQRGWFDILFRLRLHREYFVWSAP